MHRSIIVFFLFRCIIIKDMKSTLSTLKSKTFFAYKFDIVFFLYVRLVYLCIHISKLRIIKASENRKKHVIMIVMPSANT